MVKYVHVPQMQSVFKAQEDCCLTRVVYESPEIGITEKIDQFGDAVNSWDLLCLVCDRNVEMVEITKEEYQRYYNEVNEKRRQN
jgi:hypothetical protein